MAATSSLVFPHLLLPLILILVCLSNVLAMSPYKYLAATLSQADDEDLRDAFIFDGTTVLRILQQTNFITLYLSDYRDFNHNLMRFLFKQKSCALQIFIDINGVNMHKVNESNALLSNFHIPHRHRAVFLKGAELHEFLRGYSSKSGFLICVITDNLTLDSLHESAKLLWQERNIFKIYYFLRTHSWFYNPFTFNTTTKTFGALIDANSLRTDQEIFNNMNGYVIRTYIFDSVYSSVFGNATLKQITSVRGADSSTALLLSKKMNFTMELQWPDDEFFGARLDNGSYNGAIGRLMRSETEVALTGFFVKDYLTREITFTVSVYMDELCCYVMKARRIPQSILPLFAVRLDIWFGFFLVGLLSPLVWMLIRYLNLYLKSLDKYPNKPLGTEYRLEWLLGCRQHYQYARIFIDTWVIWVRVNVAHFPPFYSERVFVVSLCLVSVIYGALFESSLATVYIRPLYYRDINTLHDLDEAGFRIYIKHAAMKDDLFYGHSSLVYQNLDRKLFLVGETEERLISMMSKRGGFAAVTRASSLILDDIRYFITKKIHKIPECPKNYHIAFVLPRHSPYEEAFNLRLLRFVQAGLIDQWINEMKHKARSKIQSFSDFRAEKSNNWKVLTLRDLQLSFYALGFGCVFALLSLSVELFIRFKCSLRLTK